MENLITVRTFLNYEDTIIKAYVKALDNAEQLLPASKGLATSRCIRFVHPKRVDYISLNVFIGSYQLDMFP